ncbi:DUF4391 domain-containing protein [Psychromonas sp.]|uniref:DUF4391 domain-containing protein n=1 Tax=Psychromonas sp. TaxID=1884585 RepID=UPI003A979BCD
MNDVIDFRASCLGKGNLFDKIYEHLALPDSTFLGTRITKKMILENNDLSSSDKKLVNDAIQSVEWVNTLKPETLNIPTYVTETVEYIEVAVLKASLKEHPVKQGKLQHSLIKKVATLFHTVIPYPVILMLELNGEVAISLADKRINQADSSKLVIEHVYNSQWFNIGTLKNNENEFLNDFSLNNASRVNYYELYQDFISKLITLDISNLTGLYKASDKISHNENRKKTSLIKELKELDAELVSIRNMIKKETSMNNKMQLNLKSKIIKNRIEEIGKTL